MISDAITNHLTRACEKLRRQDSLCGSVTVFLHTNRFRRTPGRADLASKQYAASRTVVLLHPTNSTVELLRYAHGVLTSIFAFGYQFQKVGIILSDLVPGDYRQKGVIVDGPDERLLKLANVVDRINYRHGQDKLRLASQIVQSRLANAAEVLVQAFHYPLGGNSGSKVDYLGFRSNKWGDGNNGRYASGTRLSQEPGLSRSLHRSGNAGLSTSKCGSVLFQRLCPWYRYYHRSEVPDAAD